MTAAVDGPWPAEGNGGQWVRYGVNVGQNIYGVVNVHPSVQSDGMPRQRRKRTSPVSAKRHASVRARLTAMAGAVDRAAAALSAVGKTKPVIRPDRRQQ